VIEQLQRDGLKVKPFLTTNASKSEAVEALALAFERNEIRIPNDPVLIGELQAFEAKPLPSGLMRYAAPEGGHDDTVLALAIAWQGLGESNTRLSPEAMKMFTEANANLRGSRWSASDERTPSDYPLGGSSRNPFSSRRWSM
jgi:hypothetical protein